MKREHTDLVGLVVEDEFLLRLELADAITDAGWQVLEAGSGEEALVQIQNLGQIDFLITDIRLPGPVDGWAVAEAARLRHPRLPVIYVSANPINDARRVPDSIFLGKPVDVQEVLKICDRLARV
jgi:CheY-like chemotaxis protein